MILKHALFIKYVILFTLLFSCEKNSGQLIKNNNESGEKIEQYNPVKVVAKQNSVDGMITEFELKNDAVPLKLYVFNEGNSYLKVDDNVIPFALEFDFIDTDDLKTIDEILLFEKDQKYMLLVPTYSESSSTFAMLEFSKNGKFVYRGNRTYSQEVFDKIKNIPFKKRFYILKGDGNNEPNIYIKNDKQDLIFSEIVFTETDSDIKAELEKIASFQMSQSKNTGDDYLLFQRELLNQFLLNNITAENVLTTNSKNKIVKIVDQYFSAKDFNTDKFHERMSAGSDSKKYKELLPVWKNSLLQLDFDAIVPHDDLPNWKYPFEEISDFKPVINLYKDIPGSTATDKPFYHIVLYTTLMSWTERKKIFKDIEFLKNKIRAESVR